MSKKTVQTYFKKTIVGGASSNGTWQTKIRCRLCGDPDKPDRVDDVSVTKTFVQFAMFTNVDMGIGMD